jgi:NAD dependent epimerase/dehydratase
MSIQTETLTDCRVLVTGAEGFIGSHLVDHLLDQGATVRAMVCYNSFGTTGWLDPEQNPKLRKNLDIVSGDIRDPFFVSQASQDIDYIFHLAALIAIPFSYVAPQSYVETNITGTLNVLEACRRHNVKRMIHTSTSEVYGTAMFTPITEEHPLQGQSPYSASKIGADHMVQAYARSFDLPAVILRPFNTFGPRQSERAVIPTVIRQILDNTCAEVGLGDLTPVRDFNYVKDIAEAFIRLAMCEKIEAGTAYNAGSGYSVTIAEMVDLVERCTGIKKPIKIESSRWRPKNSEVFELIADAQKLETACGWKSETDIESGLAQTIDWWRGIISANHHRKNADYQL